MNKKQAIELFKETHADILANKKQDKPLLRMAWNDFVDHLNKNGDITDKQAYTWDHPSFIK